jgi:hypothetical protein
VITIIDDDMSTLDIDTVQAFLLVAELQGFTRAAEALGTTQAAVSMKLQRLESVVGKRLVERSPRAVALTAAGAAFLPNARALIEAHDRALSGETPARQQLSLGISDHAAGPELVPLLERLHAMSSQLALSVTIGFSREMLDAYDAGELDAVVVRQEGSRRGGEKLTVDEFGWTERFVGGGVTAVVAAALAVLAVAPLARRIAPPGLVDIGPAEGLPRLASSKVMLHSKVSDPAKLAALRTLAATFRSVVAAV